MSIPTDTPRRTRKKAATRDAIHRAALELFVDRGFDAVTVDEIAARADVATSTFFRHFPTKESTVLVDLERRRDELLDAIDALPADTPIDRLVAGAIDGWQVGRREPDRLRAEAMLLATTPALQARFHNLLVDWETPIAERLVRRYGTTLDTLEVHLIAAWIVTTIRVVIWEWCLGSGEVDVFELGRMAVGRLGGLLR